MSGMRKWVETMYGKESVCRKWNPSAVPFADWIVASSFPQRAKSEKRLRAFMCHANVCDSIMNGFELLLQEYYHAIGRKTFADRDREAHECAVISAELEAKERRMHQSESFGRRYILETEGTDFLDRQYEGW